MPTTATDIVSKLLANTSDLAIVKELVADDATISSSSQTITELHDQIEPWCGTHSKAGPTAIYQTFVDVGRYWTIENFDIITAFGGPNVSDASDKTEHVAIFGRFKYRSRSIGQVTDSPFAVWAKVDMGTEKVVYMQFMEDSLSTANSFRKSGKVVYQSDPDDSKKEYIVDV